MLERRLALTTPEMFAFAEKLGAYLHGLLNDEDEPIDVSQRIHVMASLLGNIVRRIEAPDEVKQAILETVIANVRYAFDTPPDSEVPKQ